MTEEADGADVVEDAEAGQADAAAAAETGAAESQQPAGSLVERVAELDEELAAEVEGELADAEEELAAKEADIEELEAKLKRKQADFQNFKKRQEKKLADQTARATEDLVEKLLPVRDNLARALEQDADADIRDGVESTLRELDSVLADEGVERIEPEPGQEPDPERHEVLMRVESDQLEGTIAELYRPGYEMGERVVRTAQVTVSSDE